MLTKNSILFSVYDEQVCVGRIIELSQAPNTFVVQWEHVTPLDLPNISGYSLETIERNFNDSAEYSEVTIIADSEKELLALRLKYGT